MHTTKKIKEKLVVNFTEQMWARSWTYIKTVIDIVREPILILDKNFHVMFANKPFYDTFQVKKKDTKDKIIYKLGNGQWDIPTLRKLLEGILPKHTFFKSFQVEHEFPTIGRKVMILNARQIHIKDKNNSQPFSPIILVAIEDITNMIAVAESMAHQLRQKRGL